MLSQRQRLYERQSHLVRGAWIEILRLTALEEELLSHLVRGAWIEMWYP